jgi:peptide/nickel transport system ATP-binding protein
VCSSDLGIKSHENVSKEQATKKVTELLTPIGLPPETANMYPHELSGGMKQRATIAISLALKPELIIADELTTALDVVVQRAVLEFLVGFKEKVGSSIINITHDIAVQAEICDKLAVMYAGKIVEIGKIKDMFNNPMHPYTKALIDATPSLIDRKRLVGLTGRPPSLLNPPIGCRFASRCPFSMKICIEKEPNLLLFNSGHEVACHLHR